VAYEARKNRNAGESFYQVDGTVAAFSVRQGPTGLAEVFDKATPASANTFQSFNNQIGDRYTIPKSTSVKFLKGGRVYWDRSAEQATYKPVNDRDFYVGRAAADSDTATSTVDVLLNVDPPYDIDLFRDGFQTVLVGTPAAGGFGFPVNMGGSHLFRLSATSEAQKVDALSVRGFSKDANAIVRFKFRVLSDGASGSQDASIGVADATHASDFQTVGTFVALHLDGNVTAINAQSDDTATDVAPTDTTKVYAEGSLLTNQKECWMDFRNPNDVQIYIDGELVLDGTTFTLAGSSATLFPIVHLEKGSGTDVYDLAVDEFQVWFAEQ
jgi:hypothetical protein